MITYRQARAHAQRCGVDVSRFQAVPCHLMNRWRVTADTVLHPETQEPIVDAGMWISPMDAQRMGDETGIDYIICTH